MFSTTVVSFGMQFRGSGLSLGYDCAALCGRSLIMSALGRRIFNLYYLFREVTKIYIT